MDETRPRFSVAGSPHFCYNQPESHCNQSVTPSSKSTKSQSQKKRRWDARLPRPSSTTVLSHGQLGRSNLQLRKGNIKRVRKGTGEFAIAFNNLHVKPSNGYKMIAVITAKMDELQRLIAYSDKQSWLTHPENFCGYRELYDDETLGRAILWNAIQKESSWFKLITEKWYPLLNRIHFGAKVDSGTPESEPVFSKCHDGTLGSTADTYLLANLGGYGHDDRIYLLEPSYYRSYNKKQKSGQRSSRFSVTGSSPYSFCCSSKNVKDPDVYQLDDPYIDQWLERVRQKGNSDKDYEMAKVICKHRQVLVPMDQQRNRYLLSLRLSADKYWK